MPDLSASWDVPNAFGLLSADFGHDLDSYRAALGFLSDLASGDDHDRALTDNGGSTALLTAWKGNSKFRRVYAKCAAAGRVERESPAAPAPARKPIMQDGRELIRAEDVPLPRRALASRGNAASFGSA